MDSFQPQAFAFQLTQVWKMVELMTEVAYDAVYCLTALVG